MSTSALLLIDLIQKGEQFFEAVLIELEKIGMSPAGLFPDHLCYRVETQGEYEAQKKFLNTRAKLLTETLVNGRLIATYQMPQPFSTRCGEIYLLEVPAPKEGSPYTTGFEHAEFVIDETFASLRDRYPNMNFSEPKFKVLNAEMPASTPAGQVKFHHLSLGRVIEIEEARISDIIFDFDGTLMSSQRHGALFEPIESLIRRLFERGLRLHIWTGRDPVSARQILADHSLLEIFQSLSCSDSTHSKPHPSSLTMDWKNLEPHSILMVGDSKADMSAAHAIGAIAGAALWDVYADLDSLTQAGAEVFLRKAQDIESLLNV